MNRWIGTTFAAAAFAFALIPSVPEADAGPPGNMICTKKLPNGNYDGNSCHTTVPGAPCKQLQDLCDGCACYDVSGPIDPNSRPPDRVGKAKKKAPVRAPDRRE